MDINTQNQSYWFVLREDQSNVIFSTNNFTIQNPTQVTSQEGRYIVNASDNGQYISINDTPVTIQAAPTTSDIICDKESEKGTSDDSFWDRSKIKLLLTLCLQNKVSSSNGDKEKTWTNIAAIVGTTALECRKKHRNLRRTYIRLLKKKKMGRHVKWIHFNVCDEIYNEFKNSYPATTLMEPWEDAKVRQLLSLYIDNLHRFHNSECLHKDIWKEIADQLESTEHCCYHKFKNLKKTYMTWLERNRETGKLVKKWPYLHYFERIFYNYNPNSGPWNRFKTKQLVDAYSQLSHKFKNPKFQKKQLWKQISAVVGESPSACDRKFRNLKQTYVKLKNRLISGNGITKWRYFKELDAIYNRSSDINEVHKSTLKCASQDHDYIEQLLQFYLENKNKFKDPLTKKKNIWKMVCPKLGMSPEECDRKFRNLKQTYLRLADRKHEPGQPIKWPYYSYFEKIFEHSRPVYENNDVTNVNAVSLSELKKVIQDVQERKDNDKKFESLVTLVQESNEIQRERNNILRLLIGQV